MYDSVVLVQDMLSQSQESRIRSVLLTETRSLLLDYFDSVENRDGVEYSDFVLKNNLSGLLPNQRRLTWAATRLRKTVIDSMMRSIYDRYKEGGFDEMVGLQGVSSEQLD
jgi:hypothetical protein